MTDLAALGDALPLPSPSDELKRRLAVRRSAPAQSLAGPGPSADEIAAMLALAARTPDHGKLFPWRFVVLGRESRARIADRLEPLAAAQAQPEKARAVLAKLRNPPLSVLVVSTPVPGHKVPIWEQQLSSGAVCMNLLHAADAFGYSGSWITDWYSYAPEAVAMFGLGVGEAVAGFIHLGSLPEAPLERVRPVLAERTTTLP